MKYPSIVTQPKRLCAAALIVALQFQCMSMANATISNFPGIYTTPPDVNVMFTLDDSGSMRDETIPDDSNSIGDKMWSGGWISNNNNDYTSATAATQRDKYRITSQTWRFYRSVSGNPLYYNPQVRYTPWPYPGDDTKTFPNANPAAACYYPDTLPLTLAPIPLPANPPLTITCGVTSGGNGSKPLSVNLRDRVVTNTPDNAQQNDETRGYWPATYFNYSGPALVANGQANQTNNPNNATGQNRFTKVEIRPTLPGVATAATYPKVAARTDCAGATVCTYAEELQNFANWFQYYRSRALMAKGAVGIAFARQGTNLRAGYATLHGSSTNIDGTNTPLIKLGVRKFQGNARQTFLARVYGTATATGTPLRAAADFIGRYFERSNPGNPWSEDPSNLTSVGTEFACRRSFHILTSDGYWNTQAEADNGTLTNVGNADNWDGQAVPPKGTAAGNNGTFGNGRTDGFTSDPFRDTTSNTLADYTAYSWKRDLRTNIANSVLPTTRDPAYWQHLTTFTVGIGVTNGTAGITTQEQRDALVTNKTAVAWGNAVTGGDAQKGDDLVHASMNGRGRFFLALNPTEFANDLSNALAEVADQPVELANLAADSSLIRSGGHIYQATFNPNKWSGRIFAFAQNATTGAFSTAPSSAVWEASNKMPATRNIFTLDASGANPVGSLFTWTAGGLNTAQKALLNNDSTLLDYLRGSDVKEALNGGPFRDRARNRIGAVAGGVLGDIVNASPVKGPDGGGSYQRVSDDAQATAYTNFRTAANLDNQRNTLFAGANDGMLHAFNTVDGVERFAYVPNAVYSVIPAGGGTAEKRLAIISEKTYTHRFLVDGPLNIADAFYGGSWHSVLAAGLGAGARGVYAMDITNPAVGTGGFGTNKILWEFTDANNADMGFVMGQVHVVRMRNGVAAVMFGNGYDSANGQAKFFILNANTGAVIRQFAVGAAFSLAQGRNGLASPNFILNSKREVTRAWAGDLKGNLWTFDLSSDDPAAWNVAFAGQPLYTNSGGANQPITVTPEITAHPNGGVLLTYGTGKLFETEDTATSGNVNLNTQIIASVWDKPGQTTGISGSTALVQRSIPAMPTFGAGQDDLFQTTDMASPPNNTAIDWSTKRGWYISLSSGGERVNINPQQVRKVMLVIANTPVTDPCSFGGKARIFGLDPLTGVAPQFAVFDANGSGTVDDADKYKNIYATDRGVFTQAVVQQVSDAPLNTPPPPSTDSTKSYQEGQVTDTSNAGKEIDFESGTVTAVKVTDPPETCDFLLSIGASDPESPFFDKFKACLPTKPRISWRQLK